MRLKLVVTAPFSTRFTEAGELKSFTPGDDITEAGEIAAVKASHPAYVVAAAAEPPEGDPAFAERTAEARKPPKTETPKS